MHAIVSPVHTFFLLAAAGVPGHRVLAAEQQEPPMRPEALVSPESMVQMLLALTVVVLIIVGLAIFIKRFSLAPGSSSGTIKILGGLPLNSKDRLLLIQVGDEQILISASPGRIGKVHDLRAPLDPEQIRVATKSDGNSFNNLLNQMLNRS